MAFAHVQGVVGTGFTTALALTVSSTGAGNLIVVSIMIDATSVSTPADVTSVTDNQGNTYAKAAETSVLNAGGTTFEGLAEQWYAVGAAGGVTTVTVHISASSTVNAAVSEFSGGATSSPLGATGSGSDASFTATSFAVGTFSPASGNLIVGTNYCEETITTWTAGTNYTMDVTTSRLGVEYRLASSTSETAPFSVDATSRWAGVAAEYKLAPTFDATSMQPALMLAVQTPELTGFAVVGY